MKRRNITYYRTLRKNQTDVERKLWSVLRNRRFGDVKFRRQYSINNYILDFYSPEYKLGIEADGGQHYEDVNREKDEIRTKRLNDLGVRILRFNDLEILNNIEGICKTIYHAIRTPHLNSLPKGERK